MKRQHQSFTKFICSLLTFAMLVGGPFAPSVNAASAWSSVSTDSHTIKGAMASDGAGNLYAIGGNDFEKVFKRSNDGTWTVLNSNQTLSRLGSMEVDGSGNLYVAAWSGDVWKYTAEDSTWSNITYNIKTLIPSGIEISGITLDSSGNLFVGAWNGTARYWKLLKETTSWETVTPSVPSNDDNVAPTYLKFDSSGNLWVASRINGRVYKQQAGSSAWSNVTGGTPKSPMALVISPSGDVIVASLDSVNSGMPWEPPAKIPKMWKMKSGESKWTDITGDLAGKTIQYIGGAALSNTGGLYVSNQLGGPLFTTTLAVLPPDPPGVPQNLAAASGDRQAALHWDSVTGATYYNLYSSTTAGNFDDATIATVTEAAYTWHGLTNGSTYYFVVKAGNAGGLSAESNEAGATPATFPAAPTNVWAAPGNGEATIHFTAPTDNGGSEITGYEVTASPGDIRATGASSPITVTGLVNGTAYTFTVKAMNAVDKSEASAPSAAVTPRVPPAVPPAPPQPANPQPVNSGVDVLVNGKPANAGTATTVQINNQSVTTVAIDAKKLDDMLAAEGRNAVLTLPISVKSDVVVGELTGQMVKNMETKQAVLEIKTDRASYALPAHQINIDAISKQLGTSVDLQEIKVRIQIAASAPDTVKVVESAAETGKFTLVAPPVEFTVTATHEGTVTEVSKFNAYVERTISIPEGVDPAKITTAVVVDPDGTARHVPTKVVEIDGKHYAKINSLTNSTYSVVWHQLEFKDVENHWAKDAVNDMGSRMVVGGMGDGIFNPDLEVTRAEFAAIVVRGLGLKPESGTAPFTDVKASDWYNSAVRAAYDYKLISGFEDGTFRPEGKVTREQAMLIVSKAMAVTELQGAQTEQTANAVLQAFHDADKVSSWAWKGLADSVSAGIISGRNGEVLAPKAYMTRAEVAVMMRLLLQKSDLINE